MADAILTAQTCTMCGESKPTTNEFFSKLKTGKYGLASRCKICAAAVAAAWRKANPGRAAAAAAKWRANNIEIARARESEYRSRHKEEGRARSAQWRKDNPERHKEALSRYRLENPDKIREMVKRYGVENAEKIKHDNAQWYSRNREYAIEKSQERREANRDQDRESSRNWYHNNLERGRESRRQWAENNPDRKRVHSQNRLARKRASGGSISPDIVEKLMVLQRGKCACCGKKLTEFHLDHIVPLALNGPHEDSNMQLLLPKCNMRKGAKPPEEYARSIGKLI